MRFATVQHHKIAQPRIILIVRNKDISDRIFSMFYTKILHEYPNTIKNKVAKHL